MPNLAKSRSIIRRRKALAVLMSLALVVGMVVSVSVLTRTRSSVREESIVIPTEEQAGTRLRELHRAWQAVKAGGQSAERVCEEFDWFPAACLDDDHNTIGLGGLPDGPPSWTASYVHAPNNRAQPNGRMMQVPCRQSGTGKRGTNDVLVYYSSKHKLQVRYTHYWNCYQNIEIDEGGHASVPMVDEPFVMPTEAQAGARLRGLYRAWQDLKAGERSAESVCTAFALLPEECVQNYREIGLADLPDRPPTWTNSFQYLQEENPELPKGRVLEVPCRVRSTGEPGTNRVLVYQTHKRGLRIHFTDYWHCYNLAETGRDSPQDEDYEAEVYLKGEEPEDP